MGGQEWKRMWEEIKMQSKLMIVIAEHEESWRWECD